MLLLVVLLLLRRLGVQVARDQVGLRLVMRTAVEVVALMLGALPALHRAGRGGRGADTVRIPPSGPDGVSRRPDQSLDSLSASII